MSALVRKDSSVAADKRPRRSTAVHVTTFVPPSAGGVQGVASEPSPARICAKCASGASPSGTISESVAKENQALRDEIKGLRHSIEFHTQRADKAEASLLTLEADLRALYRQKEEALLLEITALQEALTVCTEFNDTQGREFQAQKAAIEQSFRDRIEAVDTKYITQAFCPKRDKTSQKLPYDPAMGANYCPLPPRSRKGSSAMIKELLTSGTADTSGDAAVMASILANARTHSQSALCFREE